MNIKLLKTYGKNKVGDMIEMEDEVAKSLVEAGMAEQITGEPVNEAVKDAVQQFRKGVADVIKDEIQTATKGMKDKKFSTVEVLPQETDPKAGFKSLGHFAYDFIHSSGLKQPSNLLKGYMSNPGIMTKAVEGLSVSGEGVLAPAEFAQELISTALEGTTLAGKARQVQMARHTLTYPVIDVSSNESTLFGGVELKNVAEGDTKNKSKPAFSSVTLTVNTKAGYFVLTEELMEDNLFGNNLQNIITDLFKQSIMFEVDYDMWNGNGIATSEGVLNYAAAVTVNSDSAGSIIPKDILNMYAQMLPAYAAGAEWFCSPDTLPELFAGSVIGQVPTMLQPGTGMLNGLTLSILGKPLTVTEKLPAFGQKGCLAFVNPSAILMGTKIGGLKVAESPHVYFLSDQNVVRVAFRWDARAAIRSTITPRNGGPEMSPYVLLDAVSST